MAFSRKNKMAEADPELDMVPIMNMFLVLIPFLLLSASFLHIKAINTSVPVLASSTASDSKNETKKSDVKVKVIVEIKAGSIILSAMSDELDYETLKNLGVEIDHLDDDTASLEQLASQLEKIKDQYPKSDTLVLVPGKDTYYETIIQAMDYTRRINDKELFKNVVLSGKVG